MSEDIERRLERLTSDPPGPAVRSRVLAAVNAELARRPGPPSRRIRSRPGLIAAASLLAAVLLNLWVNAALDRRMARILGPPTAPRQAVELAADVATVTDAETGEWALRRLSASSPRPSAARPYADQLRELIRQVTVEFKEPRHEATEEDPQVDRHLRGRLDHGPAAGERVLRLEHRNRA